MSIGMALQRKYFRNISYDKKSKHSSLLKMENTAKVNLIKNTFENSFDKNQFSIFVKNLLNTFDEKNYNIPIQNSQNSIKSLKCIGKYKNSNEEIDILIAHLKNNSSLERSRANQRNCIAWHLKKKTSDAGALVAFVPPEQKDWRFSFVQINYKFDNTGRVKVESTPARRSSFLVGENETSHTAKSSLLSLLNEDNKNPTLKDLEEAFSVEKVTKEFFIKYHALFDRLKRSLDEIIEKDEKLRFEFKTKKIDSADFSKKLLGQIIFLYFLQKKGWFGVKKGKEWGTGSKKFIRELFNKKHGSYKNFFNDILEPLFYNALNKQEEDYNKQFQCRIPFLNGGLFEPINGYRWETADILLPDSLFSNQNKTKEGDIGDGILDIFDRYNFTVREDEPLEKEVAIDPEMLGQVFENLLESKKRKSKGAYYTPREIVHYMCQESLINYLAEEFKGKIQKSEIETLIKHGEDIVENEVQTASQTKETKTYFYKLSEKIRKHALLIDQSLANIRICDPAVGSGAFPVGMMHEIIKARDTLWKLLKKPKPSYHFKRHAIEHCLYGVDIDSGAIEIAKLRLWLSLIVDEEDRNQVQPLPNLDYKIVCGHSLLEIEIDLFNFKHFNKLEKLKAQYINEPQQIKKEKLKEQIEQLFEEIIKLAKNIKQYRKIVKDKKIFDFEIYFSEVFREKKGFDIVIANPPYVKESVNKSIFDGLRKSPYYQGKMDLWYFFTCKGIDIAKPSSGIISFIAQNNWVTSYGARIMRSKVIEDSKILTLIDFGDFKVFDAAIQTMVMLFQKNNSMEIYNFDYRRLTGKNLTSKDMISILKKESNPKEINKSAEYLFPKIQREKLLNQKLTFNNPKKENILNKLSKKSNFYLKEKEVAQGIVPNPDIVGKRNIKYISKDKAKKLNINIGDSVFVISKNFFKNLNKNERNYIKPLYEPIDLEKYLLKDNNKEIIYLTKKNSQDIKGSISNILNHLKKFKEIMNERRENKNNKIEYYHLHWPRNEHFFKNGSKILSIRKCRYPTFVYTEKSTYVMMSVNIIKTPRMNMKYLTGVLNSKLITFWLKHKGKMQGSNYQIDKEPILSIPLIEPSKAKQKPIIDLVDKILKIIKTENYTPNPTKQAQIQKHEKEIDRLVYKLYNLTSEEIQIVETS